MKLATEARVFIAVEPKWYEALQMISMIRDDDPEMGLHLLLARWLFGTIASSDDTHGLWVKISKTQTEYPDMSVLVPWQHIISLSLPGSNEDNKLMGFVQSKRKKP